MTVYKGKIFPSVSKVTRKLWGKKNRCPSLFPQCDAVFVLNERNITMQRISRVSLMRGVFTLVIGGGLGIAFAEEAADGEKLQSFIPQGSDAGAELFPPNAKPGGC